jgi:hypothetical protein
LTEENRPREIRGLLEAAKLPGPARTLMIVTLDQSEVLRENGLEITLVPAWQWLD